MKNKNLKDLEPPILDTAISPDCDVDQSEFEWIGQDEKRMQSITRPSTSFWKDAFGRIKSDKVAITFTIILLIMIVCAIIIPFVSPYTIDMQHLDHKHAGFLFSNDTCFHIFGTDNLGRDLFVRVWDGARISLLIAFVAVIINVFIGIVYGGISGYFGGIVDNILMRIAEIVNGIPYLLIVILLTIIMKPGVGSIIIALALVGWVGTARLVRGEVIRLKEQEFVVSAKSMGASSARIIRKHLIPNILSIVIVNLTLAIPNAIFTEAFLSFIGLGVQVPQASWGSLANEGIQYFQQYPMELIWPALFISLTMLSFNLLGDKLRDAFDPKLRR